MAKTNAEARRRGLAHTHYTDASGVAPGDGGHGTEDQLPLAMAAMGIPAFACIVSMAQATLPVAGLAYNVDAQLATNGIVGVKSGFTTTAGRGPCSPPPRGSAAEPPRWRRRSSTRPAMPAHPSAPTDAFVASQALLTSADHALERATVVSASAPWAISTHPGRHRWGSTPRDR